MVGPPSTAASVTSRTATGTGAAPLPPSVLPRRVLRWLQSLQLSVPVGRVPRTEVSNGYVIAEILQRHNVSEGFQEIYMPSFESGTALETKLSNWGRLKAIFEKESFAVPTSVIDATIHCKRGGAEHFLLLLHAHLTKTKIAAELPRNPDFSDSAYQASLPYFARPTAATVIKANVRPLEAKTHPDLLEQSGQVNSLVGDYIHRDQDDRAHNPARYNRHPLDEKGIPTRPLPLTVDFVDTSEMHKTAQFVKTSRQQPLGPIEPKRASLSASGAVGPVGHTTTNLNSTKRRESDTEPPQADP